MIQSTIAIVLPCMIRKELRMAKSWIWHHVHAMNLFFYNLNFFCSIDVKLICFSYEANMFSSANFYIQLLTHIFCFQIYAVSGKLVLARDNELLANTSEAEKMGFKNRPFISAIQNSFRLPISTTVKSAHAIITSDGKQY